MLPAVEITAIGGSAVDSEACLSKPDPRGKPPLAFYALSRPGVVSRKVLAEINPLFERVRLQPRRNASCKTWALAPQGASRTQEISSPAFYLQW